MNLEEAKKRVKELTSILNDCIEKYYMGNESDVSDYDYDMMMRELSKIENDCLSFSPTILPRLPNIVNSFDKRRHRNSVGKIR